MKQFLMAARHSRWRLALVPAMLAAAAFHLPVISAHLAEAPYMGILFVALSGACVVLAAVLINFDSPAVYALAVLTCGSAVVGYGTSRLVAFPMLADDVGNWTEPLGVASVLAELVVVVTGCIALRGTRQESR